MEDCIYWNMVQVGLQKILMQVFHALIIMAVILHRKLQI